mmetsp:Transcript_16621/g.35916  ORF Transcript_16621/g.35916 Transcript_16621/m.35916 type:complete len:131 (+) Transcript_16621:1670-2062(+)
MRVEAVTMVAGADAQALAKETIGITAGKSIKIELMTTQQEATTNLRGENRARLVQEQRMRLEGMVIIQATVVKGPNTPMGEKLTDKVGTVIIIVLREVVMNNIRIEDVGVDVEITEARVFHGRSILPLMF